jgi:uncharacterized membrane protein YeaQ/YmgE (transglycosylase-associated protein family)
MAPLRGTADRRLTVNWIAWIVSGLVIGAVAKLVMPGKDPGGLLVTTLLGIGGAVVGGFVGQALGFYAPGQAAGWIVSILGAVVLLAVYRAFVKPNKA